MEKFVSIWVGKFESKKDFENYIAEVYDDNGDSSSIFMQDFTIDYIDNQFQECFFFNKNLNLELLADASYAASFLSKLSEFNDENSIILLYDFKYEQHSKGQNKVRFLGCYTYEQT